MSFHQCTHVGAILMRCTRTSSAFFIIRTVNFFLSPRQEPSSLPDGDVIGLFVSEAHIVHQSKDLFQENLFIRWRQAKKSSRLMAWRPLTPHRNVGIGYVAAF